MMVSAPHTNSLLTAQPAACPFGTFRRRQRGARLPAAACRAKAGPHRRSEQPDVEAGTKQAPLHRRLLSGAAAAALVTALTVTPAGQGLAADAAKVCCMKMC